MNCDVLARYIDLYLDGELAIEERAEVEAHLNCCESCRRAATLESRFRQSVRRAMLSTRAPASLHDQIVRRMRERETSDAQWRFVPILAYVAAVLSVAVIGYGVVQIAVPEPDPAERAVAAHQATSGSEFFGDRAAVADFVAKHASFASREPLPAREDTRLLGARLAQLGGRPAVIYLYDVAGRRVSVAQYPAPPAEGERPRLRVDRRDGFMVATWRDGELEQTVVGDVPETEMPRFIPASWGN